MLTYHHLIQVMEYLREQGASQSALDSVLAALWAETHQSRGEGEPASRDSIPLLS